MKYSKKYLDIRLGMKEYIKSVMDEASENGSPVIRAQCSMNSRRTECAGI